MQKEASWLPGGALSTECGLLDIWLIFCINDAMYIGRSFEKDSRKPWRKADGMSRILIGIGTALIVLIIGLVYRRLRVSEPELLILDILMDGVWRSPRQIIARSNGILLAGETHAFLSRMLKRGWLEVRQETRQKESTDEVEVLPSDVEGKVLLKVKSGSDRGKIYLAPAEEKVYLYLISIDGRKCARKQP